MYLREKLKLTNNISGQHMNFISGRKYRPPIINLLYSINKSIPALIYSLYEYIRPLHQQSKYI